MPKHKPGHEPEDYKKTFLRLFKELTHKHTNPLVPFAEFAALAIANGIAVRDTKWKEREDRYMQLVKQFSKLELDSFSHMLGCLVLLLEQRIHDPMGEIYMSDEVGHSRWDSDVAFTPWHVSYMVAKMQLGDFKIPERGFFTLGEPAAGTGGMIIAAAACLKDLGFNFQQVMHVTATEIRATLAHLLYVQLSLLGIAATVIHGDSLAQTKWSVWHTPMHHLGFWEPKLRRLRAEQAKAQAKLPPPPPPTNKRGQFALFQENQNDR